ncbi:MAG: SRPBCC family protein [Halobacteriales archaeon]|nr:SRPBCC family protein [Halobacteriales archaeon]
MATYEREVWVDAPLESVWEFHSTVDGLVALTPDWMGLEIESVEGPDGSPDPAVLETGTRISMRMQPLGIGPQNSWVSEITARDHDGDEAEFTDVMHGGPFRSWRHTHRFRAVDDGTLITDHVEYELPLGPLSGISGAVSIFFAPMFRYRHRRTQSLLE